jgi:hypothetical protein
MCPLSNMKEMTMDRRPVLATACFLAISAQLALAQAPTTPAPQTGTGRLLPNAAVPPPPPPPPRAPVAQTGGQPVNIKVDFTITDQRGAEPPIKRGISVIAADRNLGRVRSSATVFGQSSNVPLDVDATPTLLNDGKIRLQFTLSYDWPAPPADPARNTAPAIGAVTRSLLSDSVTLILENGKSMVAAQSADPVGDRQVSVEVKATILK